MNELQVTARLSIHPGKLDAFKTYARACIKSTQEEDTGTLQYDWFLNADQTECIVREKYKDSNAVLEHMGNLGDLFGQLMGVSDMSFEVYGRPSEELMKATEGLDIKLYSAFSD